MMWTSNTSTAEPGIFVPERERDVERGKNELNLPVISVKTRIQNFFLIYWILSGKRAHLYKDVLKNERLCLVATADLLFSLPQEERMINGTTSTSDLMAHDSYDPSLTEPLNLSITHTHLCPPLRNRDAGGWWWCVSPQCRLRSGPHPCRRSRSLDPRMCRRYDYESSWGKENIRKIILKVKTVCFLPSYNKVSHSLSLSFRCTPIWRR